MSKTLTQGLLAVPEPSASQQQCRIKLIEILATPIFQFAAFEEIPDSQMPGSTRGRNREDVPDGYVQPHQPPKSL